jgi:preprotein translocase subunit SecY
LHYFPKASVNSQLIRFVGVSSGLGVGLLNSSTRRSSVGEHSLTEPCGAGLVRPPEKESEMRNNRIIVGVAVVVVIVVGTVFFMSGDRNPPEQQASPHALDQNN